MKKTVKYYSLFIYSHFVANLISFALVGTNLLAIIFKSNSPYLWINIVMMSNSLVSTFLISLKTSIYKHFAEFKVGKSRRKNQSWCRVSACDVLHTVQKDAAFQAANTR